MMTRWFVCRVTSGRKSAQYGIPFSYPLYISFISVSILLENPYMLSVTALIALLGVILPMHPFDYVYHLAVAVIPGRVDPIPGRGSELDVSSAVALLFSVAVILAIMSGIPLSYAVMPLVYVLFSVLFISVLLSTDDFSIDSIHRLLARRGG